MISDVLSDFELLLMRLLVRGRLRVVFNVGSVLRGKEAGDGRGSLCELEEGGLL